MYEYIMVKNYCHWQNSRMDRENGEGERKTVEWWAKVGFSNEGELCVGYTYFKHKFA